MATEIRLLSGGAAQALVTNLRGRFAQATGCKVEGTFGAVGAMRDRLLAGEPCDLVILTQALVDQLAGDGHVVVGSDTPLGTVKTGVAVKAGRTQPDVSTPDALKAALLAAPAVYLPDPQKATAGIHFMKVLQALGIDGPLAPRLRAFPNGATAMREMAQSPEPGAIGCTQVTEILFTPGVQLVGVLPAQFELATVYTAGVCTKAREPGAAREFIALLAGAGTADVRKGVGFEPL